jgi:thiosulfate/3-mercaptopyruvate sulfurtransferase
MLLLQSVAPLLLSVALPYGLTQEAKQEEGFANPELLVTTAWLAEHGSDEGVVVVDVRGKSDFEAGHIPGAVSIPASSTLDPKSRGNIGSREDLAALIGAQGISAGTHAVIYDGGNSTSAARVFWTLEVYGHQQTSVVDGGFAKWQAEERETTAEPTPVTSTGYEIGSSPDKLSTLDQVLEDVENPDVVMLDSRSAREYDSGRIPAAVRIEWTENYSTDEVPVFKSPAELRKLYGDQGVTADKRVHAY